MHPINRIRPFVFVLALGAFVVLGVFGVLTPAPLKPAAPVRTVSPSRPVMALPAVVAGDCTATGAFVPAANANAAGLPTLPVAPFGVAETGWAAYQPLVSREIGTACDPLSVGFASHLAAWQKAHSLSGSGGMDAATIAAMANIWLLRRPFVLVSRQSCPASPDPGRLATIQSTEAYGGKLVLARPAALDAYRRMTAALRLTLPGDAAGLRIASAYRDPVEEAARCADGGCGAAGRARCSAHRTGLAFDLYLGNAPGLDPFSTDPANRLYLSRTPTYRWLVANADHFGFVNYPYEPWHWEWTGEPI